MQRAVWDIFLGLCAYQKSASLGCVVILAAVTDLSGNRRLEDRWLQVWKVTSLSTGQWLLLIATAVQPSTCVCVCVCIDRQLVDFENEMSVAERRFHDEQHQTQHKCLVCVCVLTLCFCHQIVTLAAFVCSCQLSLLAAHTVDCLYTCTLM